MLSGGPNAPLIAFMLAYVISYGRVAEVANLVHMVVNNLPAALVRVSQLARPQFS
jgi:hypothetical protein